MTGAEPPMTPIFVVGMSRSGTSLLQTLLDGHPRLVALIGESRLFEHRPRINFDLILDQMGLQHIYAGKWARPGATRDSVADELARRLAGVHDLKGVMAAIVEVTRRHIAPPPAAPVHWLEKTPTNYYYIPTLERMYGGEARYLFLVRDPRDVLHSQMGLRVPNTPDRFVRQALLYSALRDRFRRSLAGRMLEVCYETLVSDPDHTMRDIARFLAIDFDPILTRPTRFGAGLDDHIDGGRVWLRQSVVDSSIGKGAKGLSAADRAYVEDWLSAELAADGYDAGRPGLTRARGIGAAFRLARSMAPRYLRDIPDEKLEMPVERLRRPEHAAAST